MAWCLPQNQVRKFKDAIVSGRINPEDLATMTSAERRALFAKELGDVNAEPVNTQFESKLLLKNRQQGYVSWARKMLGENTPAGRDVISRVQRMENVLSPTEEKAFLEDLVAHKLGTRVTAEEAGKIAELSKKVTETEATGGREWGKAQLDLQNY